MKIKRAKKVNKILSFYSNNFGFRKPYQILVDGTMCFFALKASKFYSLLSFESFKKQHESHVYVHTPHTIYDYKYRIIFMKSLF
jgi:hypothetical protein